MHVFLSNETTLRYERGGMNVSTNPELYCKAHRISRWIAFQQHIINHHKFLLDQRSRLDQMALEHLAYRTADLKRLNGRVDHLVV